MNRLPRPEEAYAWRTARRLTQAAVAEQIKVTRPTYVCWETGKRKTHPEALERLAKLVYSQKDRWTSIELELKTMLALLRGGLPDEIKWLKYRAFIVGSHETLALLIGEAEEAGASTQRLHTRSKLRDPESPFWSSRACSAYWRSGGSRDLHTEAKYAKQASLSH